MTPKALKELVDKIKQTDDKVDLFAYSLGLQDGAKWQQEQDKQMDNERKGYNEHRLFIDIANALHSVELKDNKNYYKIYEGMKEWFKQNKSE
jgi:hypothetical protein